jgi:hypothetical protein
MEQKLRTGYKKHVGHTTINILFGTYHLAEKSHVESYCKCIRVKDDSLGKYEAERQRAAIFFKSS